MNVVFVLLIVVAYLSGVFVGLLWNLIDKLPDGLIRRRDRDDDEPSCANCIHSDLHPDLMPCLKCKYAYDYFMKKEESDHD